MLTVFRTEIAPRATLLPSIISGLWRRHGCRHWRAGRVTISPPTPARASHRPLTRHLTAPVRSMQLLPGHRHSGLSWRWVRRLKSDWSRRQARLVPRRPFPPPALCDSLPAAQKGDAAKLGGSFVQSRGLKTRTSGVAAMGGDSTRDTEQASGPRCCAPSPGAHTGPAVAFLSPFVPHRTTPAPDLTCDTVGASGTAVPPPSISQMLDGTAATGAPSVPRLSPQDTVNQFLEFVGVAPTP